MTLSANAIGQGDRLVPSAVSGAPARFAGTRGPPLAREAGEDARAPGRTSPPISPTGSFIAGWPAGAEPRPPMAGEPSRAVDPASPYREQPGNADEALVEGATAPATRRRDTDDAATPREEPPSAGTGDETRRFTAPLTSSPSQSYLAGQPADPPTPLPESSHRFLQPLVSIDPATVPTFHGPTVEPLTAANGADALALGNAVVLAPGRSVTSPANLGLLAHELTHVARQREPRFLPPVARDDDDHLALPAREEASPTPTDEEGIARRVEARVTQAAEAELTRDLQPSPPLSLTPGERGQEVRGQGARAAWDGLPAPWEPLPAWLAPPAAGGGRVAPASAPTLTEAAEAVSALPVQRAEVGRSLADEYSATEAALPPHPVEESQPAPDLDTLARQVYAVLRRRLATELRRSG